MAPITWTGTTELPTATIAQLARDGAPQGFNAISRRAGTISWRSVPSQDGGVFDTFDAAVAWSARVEYKPGFGEDKGVCDIQVIDHGAHREIEIGGAHSLRQRAMTKKLLSGILGAFKEADPSLR